METRNKQYEVHYKGSVFKIHEFFCMVLIKN